MTKSFDRLLREALKAPGPEPPGACLDADAVAAWFEGTLGPSARAAAESHAAQCSRCQAVLAAMIRSEPPLESRPWWRSPVFAWLVPVTVAAAVLTIWVPAVQRRVPVAPAATQVAAEPPVAPSPTPATVAPFEKRAADETRARAAAAVPAPPASAKNQKAASPVSVVVPASEPSAVAGVPIESTPLKDQAGMRVDDLALRRATPPPPPAASEPAPAPAPASPAPSVAVARPLEAQAAGAPTAAPKTLAETVTLTGQARQIAPAQREVMVQAIEGPSRWRAVSPGSVQYSTDGGVRWSAQATSSGAIVTAGAAPSNTVCWLVGREGLVLRTTDARSWRRLPFPYAVDLVSVSATDENSATVAAADGRRFTTTDGGKTWKEIAGG